MQMSKELSDFFSSNDAHKETSAFINARIAKCFIQCDEKFSIILEFLL